MWGHLVKGPVQKQRLPLLKEQQAFLLCESSCGVPSLHLKPLQR